MVFNFENYSVLPSSTGMPSVILQAQKVCYRQASPRGKILNHLYDKAFDRSQIVQDFTNAAMPEVR
jgi:hypothetical protein